MEKWQSDINYDDTANVKDKMQYHIQCKYGDIAPVVLVPGDQGRVNVIIDMLKDVKKIADNRGLITYTGTYKNFPISVTSTGMGGPSAAIVYEELINIGAKILIRIGSVAALQSNIEIGDTVIPNSCIRDDGVSSYYVPDNYPAVASPFIYNLLVEEIKEKKCNFWTGVNWTHSAFYARSTDYFQQWAKKRVISMDMEASALFVIAQLRNIEAAFVATVYENRYKQSTGKEMDLSVGSIKKEGIERGNKRAIKTALDAAVKAYELTNLK